ncbi:AraC family transcriptional regulator [Marinobacter sp.]|uniref:AraC family transcriptional regulator n=1 Tax=Marinobacter sp. TaxID=50741 RepID=UPI0019E285D9|nr:AraC family transcriptional regulator [Marinobacter sp.]MBE0484648.1 AraC family transcriptional regulator [Marinobacter sp.]
MSNFDTLLHPVTISQVMINFTARQGGDRQTCLLGTGIAEEDLQAADGLVTRAQEMRLIENLILALPDIPALGFRLGLQYSVSTFGIWGFALRTSRTLRDATKLALRYLPLSTAYCQMQTFVEGDDFGIEFDPDDIPRHLRQFLLERDLATGLNLFKELSLSGFDVQAIEPIFGVRPKDISPHQMFLGLTPKFISGPGGRSDYWGRQLMTASAMLFWKLM